MENNDNLCAHCAEFVRENPPKCMFSRGVRWRARLARSNICMHGVCVCVCVFGVLGIVLPTLFRRSPAIKFEGHAYIWLETQQKIINYIVCFICCCRNTNVFGYACVCMWVLCWRIVTSSGALRDRVLRLYIGLSLMQRHQHHHTRGNPCSFDGIPLSCQFMSVICRRS